MEPYLPVTQDPRPTGFAGGGLTGWLRLPIAVGVTLLDCESTAG